MESLSRIGNAIANIAGNIPGDFCESGNSSGASPGCLKRTISIFEGTSEIQQLVIARAISGLRIE